MQQKPNKTPAAIKVKKSGAGNTPNAGPLQANTTTPAQPAKTQAQLQQSQKNLQKAMKDRDAAFDKVRKILNDAIAKDTGKHRTQLISLLNDFTETVGGETEKSGKYPKTQTIDELSRINQIPFASEQKQIRELFERRREEAKKRAAPIPVLNQRDLDKALAEAQQAAENYANLRREYDADFINANEKILRNFKQGDITGLDGTVVNWNATSFDQLLSKGNTIMVGEVKCIITSKGITTDGYSPGKDLSGFAKLAMEWGRRNNERVTLNGPEEGVLDTLKEMAKAGQNNPNEIYKHGVKLGGGTRKQMERKWWRRRPGKVRKINQAFSGGAGILSALAGKKDYDAQIAQIFALERMLNNIPNDHFATQNMSKGELYARTLQNSYNELTRDTKFDPETAAKSGKSYKDAPKDVRNGIDLELKLIIESQFGEKVTNSLSDAVDMFEDLRDGPLQMKAEDFKQALPNDRMRQNFDQMLQQRANQPKPSPGKSKGSAKLNINDPLKTSTTKSKVEEGGPRVNINPGRTGMVK